MEIKINIKTCNDCKHGTHTGQFTIGGAKPCCNHNTTVKEKGYDCFKRVIPYRIEYSNFSYRGFRVAKKIPDWCPLKRGFKY